MRLWLTLWSGRLAAYVGKKDGNVFIENGIWIIVVVIATRVVRIHPRSLHENSRSHAARRGNRFAL